MRVLLISANRTEVNMRTMPLGLACVAQAAGREGHEVKILDLVQEKDVPGSIASAIADLDPEVIGISIRNIDDQEMRNTRFLFEADNAVVSMVRKLSKAPIVLGGAGYSIYPRAILAASEADIGIEGEGEAVFNVVLERLRNNETLEGLPGVHVKGGGLVAEKVLIRAPDAFPLPDPDLLFTAPCDAGDLWIPVQTRRGCPMRCSYCSTGLIEGTIIRKRSPKSVVEWIAKLKRRGADRLYFTDNTFNLPPSYAMALCRAMACASLKVRWRCILYPYRLDESLVGAMAEVGCSEASIGFESANERVLKEMNKRFRRKDVAETCSLLKRNGIRQMVFLLLGGPCETIESVRESLAFADSLEPEFMRVTIGIRIYPGTALAEQARKEGVIAPDDDLLLPRFYIAPGLDGDEVRELAAIYMAKRPH
ncbi:MAG TPA: radical SAM protein [Syntrophorhabdaceae bacterium]|nr:radical SAM protein [Syntrophorhabdaceae bacterium]HQM81595.1 radical SAM protein [Syntrophorhabdaceae bacterium]